MTKLELKYNPFTEKTEFLIDGVKTNLECIGTGRGIRLHEYIGKFFSEAVLRSNAGPGEECVVQFYGTQDAFDDVKSACQEYLSQSEGVKIELPDFKPYPNNFSEFNQLIANKKENYIRQIVPKKEELKNPSGRKSDVEFSAIEKLLKNEINYFEEIYKGNLQNVNTILAKAEEGFVVSLPAEEEKDEEAKTATPSKELSPEARMIGVAALSVAVPLLAILSKGKTSNKDGKDDDSVKIEDVKTTYDKIADGINSGFVKNRKDLSDLLISLFEKQETALYSACEEIYRTYSVRNHDMPVLTAVKLKHPEKSFKFDQKIPDSYLSGLEIKITSSTVRIGIVQIEETIKKTLSECQTYFNNVFASAKQNLLTEMEKRKIYYRDVLFNSLSFISHIEKEILVLENKIECLDELQAEINRLELG